VKLEFVVNLKTAEAMDLDVPTDATGPRRRV
jgi:hypothetical protein